MGKARNIFDEEIRAKAFDMAYEFLTVYGSEMTADTLNSMTNDFESILHGKYTPEPKQGDCDNEV